MDKQFSVKHQIMFKGKKRKRANDRDREVSTLLADFDIRAD